MTTQQGSCLGHGPQGGVSKGKGQTFPSNRARPFFNHHQQSQSITHPSLISFHPRSQPLGIVCVCVRGSTFGPMFSRRAGLGLDLGLGLAGRRRATNGLLPGGQARPGGAPQSVMASKSNRANMTPHGCVFEAGRQGEGCVVVCSSNSGFSFSLAEKKQQRQPYPCMCSYSQLSRSYKAASGHSSGFRPQSSASRGSRKKQSRH